MSDAVRPNIIVIMSDQLRRDALGCYGDCDISTPNIDQMAANGVKFERACSTYPICVPFRFSFMTGEYAHTRLVPGIEWRMSPSERTMADEFNEAGYETLYVGKWHLYGGSLHMPGYSAIHVNRTRVPREYQGRWQKWFGFELRNGPFDTLYFEDDNPAPRRINGYQTDGLFDLSMNYITEGRDRSRPFCTVISVEPPHPPMEAPEELEQKWREKELHLPPNFSPAGDQQRERFLEYRRIYYAMVENLDMNVGRLRTFLEREDLSENTILVFVSDHGDLCGSHGLLQKQQPFEESVGIPLIIEDPTAPDLAGRTIEDPTNTEDLFPTILGLAGLTPTNPLKGEDLTPLVRGTKNGLGRDGVMLEFVSETRKGAVFHEATWRAFRSRDFKYIVMGDINGAEPHAFYDMANDLYETNNLLDDAGHQEELKRHHQLLRNEMIRTGDHYVLKPAFGVEGLNVWQDLDR